MMPFYCFILLFYHFHFYLEGAQRHVRNRVWRGIGGCASLAFMSPRSHGEILTRPRPVHILSNRFKFQPHGLSRHGFVLFFVFSPLFVLV